MEGRPASEVAPAMTTTTNTMETNAAIPDESERGIFRAGERRRIAGLAIAGGVITAIGWAFNRDAICPNILVGAMMALGFPLAGLCLIAAAFITRAGWSTAIRRIPEAMAGALPVAAGGLMIALLGIPWIYEWSHADTVAHDPLLQHKSAWLSTGFVVLRAVVILVIWMLFARAMRGASIRQDASKDVRETTRLYRLSAGFMVTFGLTYSVACFDWVMSIEPHWFSTIYGLYHISGMVLSGLAMTTLLMLALRRGVLRNVIRDDHLHDIGKLMFGFSIFWGYLWFCQHMLIWYSNIPEETTHYLTRTEGGWLPLFLLNPAINWLVPFVALLPRPAKRCAATMRNVAILILIGRWLDLWLMVMPPLSPEGPSFGLWEIGPPLAFVGVVLLVISRIFARNKPVPTGDPYLEESLTHQC